MYNYPFMNMRPGLFSRLGALRSINWGGFLDGAQKTLGVINQAIPIVYQVKPILNNAKTMFKIADEIRKPDSNKTTSNDNYSSDKTTSTNNINQTNQPIFYV